MMDASRCLLLLLLLLLVTLPGDVVSKSPFRGEITAVPRGLDVLLGNVAPRVGTTPRKPGGSGNNLLGRSSAGKLF